ncbi:MAG: nucleotidyltransferase domain-containing protein [Nocardioides sp.]|uniref:nucleotidyltransferase family protein n=1 Tax=Nocardioides sp. TaxID=35761 RepID=UPI0039E48BB6
MLTRVVEEEVAGARAVILFGSAARGEAHAASDIDLAVIAPEEWDGRIRLADSVRARLGNDCDVLHVTPEQFSEDSAAREPVIAEILRDGVALLGRMPRRSRVAS